MMENDWAEEAERLIAEMWQSQEALLCRDMTEAGARALAARKSWDFDFHKAAGDLYSYWTPDGERYSAWQFIDISGSSRKWLAPVPGLGYVMARLGAYEDRHDAVQFMLNGQVTNPETGELALVLEWLRAGGAWAHAYDRAEEWAEELGL